MAFFTRILKFIIPVFLLIISIFPHSHASNPKDTVIEMQLLIALTTDGQDTVFRKFSYYPNGFLNTVEDSPRTESRLAYFAEYDSTGKIRKLSEYRSSLLYSVEYKWKSDNRISYTKHKNGAPDKDSGEILFFGRLRAVDLPENNPLAPENFLIVRADSTRYLDGSGNIITNWYWEYDSLGRNIRWKSSTLDKTIPWVEEYTYGDLNGFPARFPALAGDIVVYIFYKPELTRYEYYSPLKSESCRQNAISDCQYLLNGRKITGETIRKVKRIKNNVILNTEITGNSRTVLTGVE